MKARSLQWRCPTCSSASGSNSLAPRTSRWVRRDTAMNSWRRWIARPTSTRRCGRNTENTAESEGSGTAQTDEIGRLLHKPGGAEHARWVFDYDPGSTDDDEAGYRF